MTDISIHREGHFGGYTRPDPSKPFIAKIGVEGQHGKVELNLSPDMSKRIVELIADEVAAAGRATADAMVASCLEVAAKPALVEGK